MTDTVTPRFVPRRSILIAIWVAIMILLGSLLFNRLAYTGIMVPISGVPEGISFGSDKLVFITTNRFSQATHFAVQVENTSPQTLTYPLVILISSPHAAGLAPARNRGDF